MDAQDIKSGSKLLSVENNKAGSPPVSTPHSPAILEEKSTLALVAEPKPPADEFPPVGKYDLLEKVAQGGMGMVYRARDRELNRFVALKLLRSGILAGPEEISRFLREAQAAGKLFHPNIVPIYEVGQHQGLHYFTMPFLPGGNLRGRKDFFPGDPETIAPIIGKVARAVHHAHVQGILHRDLKPSNILLDERGEPLVADFGLAKLPEGGADLTHTGQILGTPAYMAPEQAAANPSEITPRSDIWALGVILYELITGHLPFAGLNTDSVRLSIATSDPPSPRKWAPALDRDMETIILKCLEKSPARRYTTALELAEDLECWKRGDAIRARPISAPRRWARSARRHPVYTVLLTSVLLAAIVVFAFLQWRRAADPLTEIETQLRRGEPVTLIGATGEPVWHQWRFGQAKAQHSLATDGTFSLHTWAHSMLELLPDPFCPAYRLEAEIRHLQSEDSGDVGLYFLHPDTPDQHFGFLCRLVFNDVKDISKMLERQNPNVTFPPGTHAWFQPLLFRAPELGKQDHVTSLSSRQFRQSGGRVWRKLEVVITQEKIQALIDGERLGVLDRNDIARGVQQLFDKDIVSADLVAQRDDPSIRPGTGLGLMISQGSASFRNVRVIPMSVGDEQ
jgi:hypothetical protein